MAGTVMHLVIADRLLKPLSIHNPAFFYCGNLSPDAIMNRENYEREMKRHTHFKDHMRLYRLHEPENYDIYSKRLQLFYDNYVAVADKHQEIYLGYLTHILTDELYILEFRDQHVKKLVDMGKSPTDEAYFRQFGKDVNSVDLNLAETYEFRYPMPDILLSESNYEIPGYITRKEIADSKDFIIQKNFSGASKKEPLQTMTMESNLDFIDLCVREIPLILQDRFNYSL